jgi:hypothetical protein
MASVFSNVQVRVGRRGVASTRDAVIAALRAEAHAAGYTEADPGEPAERSVLVYARKRATWITVYDQESEAGGERNERLAATLARALDDWAVGVRVQDNEALRLTAYASGQPVDIFDGTPGHEQHPERWRPLLRDDAAVDQLRACWAGQPSFAVSTLRATARLVSFSADACSTGFRYVTEEGSGPGATTAFVRLGFRAANAPAWTASAAPSGPPRFDFHGSSVLVRGSEGGASHAAASVVNRGGSLRGLRVAVWGDAIDQGLVDVESVAITLGDPKQHAPVTATPVRTAYQGQKQVSVVELELEGVDGEAGIVNASLSLRALAPGSGRLVIGFVPKGDEQGQYGAQLPVTITPAAGAGRAKPRKE